LPIDPLKEFLLINQDTPAYFDDRTRQPIGLAVKQQPADPPGSKRRMVLTKLAYGA
jgi:hypothetical protein